MILGWNPERKTKRQEEKAKKALAKLMKKVADETVVAPRTFGFGKSEWSEPDARDLIQKVIFDGALIGISSQYLSPSFVNSIAANFVYESVQEARGLVDGHRRLKVLAPDKNLTFSIGDDAMPKKMALQIGRLRNRVRAAILTAASLVEASEIQSANEFTKREMVEVVRERQSRIANGQALMQVTYRSITVALEAFVQINEQALSAIRQAEIHQDTDKMNRAMMLHLVLVAEVTDLMVEFLNDFEVLGIADILQARDEVFEFLEEAKRRDTEQLQRNKSQSLSIDEGVRSTVLESIDNRKRQDQQIRAQWNSLQANLDTIVGEQGKIREKKETFISLREEAKTQLLFVVAASATGAIEQNIRAANSILDVQRVEIQPLSQELFDVLTARGVGQV